MFRNYVLSYFADHLAFWKNVKHAVVSHGFVVMAEIYVNY